MVYPFGVPSQASLVCWLAVCWAGNLRSSFGVLLSSYNKNNNQVCTHCQQEIELYSFSWAAALSRWKRTCKNLGIDGLDLYGGTKHSTVTAARENMSPEEIRRYLTEHQTNAAFDRYLHVDAEKQRKAARIVRSGPARILPIQFGREGTAKHLK